MYKEHLKKLETQNKEMVKKVDDVEQMAARLQSRDSKFMVQKEEVEYATQQLYLEQQKLYQLINVFEVSVSNNNSERNIKLKSILLSTYKKSITVHKI